MQMTVTILGTDYIVRKEKYDEVSVFGGKGIVGYCDTVLKEIVYCDLRTHPVYEKDQAEFVRKSEQSALRHEIVHAFLAESGLRECSLTFEDGWATNEEMVDWIALQGEKIYSAWKVAGALD